MFKTVLYLLAIFLLLLNESLALFEDQIGKFDWKKEFVGPIKYASISRSNSQNEVVFVGTEQNVVASLSLKTGEIVWRKVLEKGDRGVIQAFALVNNILFVVTGTDVVQVRGWHATKNYLTQHLSLPYPSNDSSQTLWFIRDTFLYRLMFLQNDQLHFTKFHLFTGNIVIEKTYPFSQGSADRCAINEAVLLCWNNGHVITANLTSVEFSTKEVTDSSLQGKNYIVKSSGNGPQPSFTVADGKEKILFYVTANQEMIKSKTVSESSDVYSSDLLGVRSQIVLTVNRLSKYALEIDGYELENTQNVFNKRISLTSAVGKVTLLDADCQKRTSGQVFCSILLSTSDGSVLFLRSTGKVEWMREEALSDIVTAEMIELPMSETEAEMQTEFESKELLDIARQVADIFSLFTRRISSHVFQLQKSLFGLSGILENTFSADLTKETKESKLVRDYFNLHKIILVITKQMKIFAMDNVSKELLWSYLIDDEFEPFPATIDEGEARIPLFIQRSYRHYPHPILCTVLVRERVSHKGIIISFNPIKGQFDPPVRLGYKIQQALLLPKQTVDDYIQGIAILDEMNVVHAYPEHTKTVLNELARSLFFFVADTEKCDVNGYGFGPDIENTTLVPVWNMQCTGKIVKMSGKNPVEKVHSQGRVLPDRSVLYKYINPNLIAIVSKSISPEDQKSMLTLYFVDSVTGAIVNGDVRHRALEPVYLVHSENWVVLMYFNEKARRTEIVTYELYEGKVQHNATAFSSVQTKNMRPIVDSRAYILPTAYIEAARETITEKGITSKHVLVALSTGNVIELPWIILDPRRPFASTPETKEEGVLPYMPEIPIPTETMINYNKTLHRVRGILTSPSGLESTSLTFVYGLDLFYTRVAPSKTFDLLKEDFDYMLIVIVLFILIVLTVITKHLAYRRALKQAWR